MLNYKLVILALSVKDTIVPVSISTLYSIFTYFLRYTRLIYIKICIVAVCQLFCNFTDPILYETYLATHPKEMELAAVSLVTSLLNRTE